MSYEQYCLIIPFHGHKATSLTFLPTKISVSLSYALAKLTCEQNILLIRVEKRT